MKTRLDAFAVREEKKRTYWTRIGAGFPIKDGEGGMNVLLEAMPPSLRGRYTIVLLPPKEKAEVAESE